MGHESQIELWLTPNDHVPLCWFQNRLASLRRSNEKPLTRKIQNRWATPATEYLVWKVRTDPAQSRGLEARKTPAVGEVFFLDFPFYRTNQNLTEYRDAICTRLGKHISAILLGCEIGSVKYSR